MQPPATFRLNELSVKLLVERGDPTRCWIDEEWPGQVEVHLRVSDGSTATLTDKAPVFDGDDVLIPGAELPMDIEIP